MNSIEFCVFDVKDLPSGKTLVVGTPNNGEALALGARRRALLPILDHAAWLHVHVPSFPSVSI